MKVCPHCQGDIEIRNPTGHCDHLYYPDMCEVCLRIHSIHAVIRQVSEEAYEYVIQLEAELSRLRSSWPKAFPLP